jgi:hypothetical protein
MPNDDIQQALKAAIPPQPFYQTADQAVLNAPEGSAARGRAENLIDDRNTQRLAEIDSRSAAAMARAQLSANTALKKQYEQDAKKLTDFVEKSEGYKNYSVALDAQKNIEAALADPSGYGDLAAMFAFMRALDPASVVREGEQTLFRATGNVPQRIANMLNKAVKGETLGDDQRKEVQAVINRLVAAKKTGYDRVYARANARGQRVGIPAEEWDPFARDVKAPESPGTTTASGGPSASTTTNAASGGAVANVSSGGAAANAPSGRPSIRSRLRPIGGK